MLASIKFWIEFGLFCSVCMFDLFTIQHNNNNINKNFLKYW